MKKVIELEIVIQPWGKTSGDVLIAAQGWLGVLNTPAPFETECDRPDMNQLTERMKAECDKATAQRRKGMMISSRFTVVKNGECVEIWHVRNENGPRLFLKLKPINP